MHVAAFETLFDEPAPQTPLPKPAYAVVPEGQAEVEIMAASVGDVPWKVSDTNPTGACLKLRLSAGRGFAFVFADVPRDKPQLIAAMAAALGLVRGADGKARFPSPEELVGRRINVEIGHYQARNGETKATVRRWLPAASTTTASTTAAAPQPPMRPSRTRPAAQSLPDDGVPF